MKYERASRIEGQPQWHRVYNNKPPKRWSSKDTRRHADDLLREEDADTSVPIWDDPVWIAFVENPQPRALRRRTRDMTLDEVFAAWGLG